MAATHHSGERRSLKRRVRRERRQTSASTCSAIFRRVVTVSSRLSGTPAAGRSDRAQEAGGTGRPSLSSSPLGAALARFRPRSMDDDLVRRRRTVGQTGGAMMIDVRSAGGAGRAPRPRSATRWVGRCFEVASSRDEDARGSASRRHARRSRSAGASPRAESPRAAFAHPRARGRRLDARAATRIDSRLAGPPAASDPLRSPFAFPACRSGCSRRIVPLKRNGIPWRTTPRLTAVRAAARRRAGPTPSTRTAPGVGGS